MAKSAAATAMASITVKVKVKPASPVAKAKSATKSRRTVKSKSSIHVMPSPQEFETTSINLDDELETEPGEESLDSSFSASITECYEAAVVDISEVKETRQARRDRVVLEHLPLVRAIAVRVHENLPVHVDLDDLVHAGILGLFDAASKYNPEKQVVFSSYAKHRIKGAILDSLRQLDWASRDLRRRHKQVEAVTRDLASELQRNPTETEIAGKLGIEVDRWRQMMVDLRNVGLISASTRANDQEELPAPDFPSKPETQPDNMCAHEQLRSVLGVAMKTLPERYQKVVTLYYTNEMTMKEIGGVLGINESRVSQIHKAALEKMQVVLQTNGIGGTQAF